MTLDIDILLLLGIVYFTICTISIVRLLFFSSNRELRKSILIFSLVYEGLDLAFEIFDHGNALNYGIFISHAIGGTLGLIAGCYLGYQVCILAGLDPIESPDITNMVTFMGGAFYFHIGSFFGNVLLPI
jgi:hypothetical protein